MTAEAVYTAVAGTVAADHTAAATGKTAAAADRTAAAAWKTAVAADRTAAAGTAATVHHTERDWV